MRHYSQYITEAIIFGTKKHSAVVERRRGRELRVATCLSQLKKGQICAHDDSSAPIASGGRRRDRPLIRLPPAILANSAAQNGSKKRHRRHYQTASCTLEQADHRQTAKNSWMKSTKGHRHFSSDAKTAAQPEPIFWRRTENCGRSETSPLQRLLKITAVFRDPVICRSPGEIR